MILYPMIELLDGQCISLFRGRTQEPHIWNVDPVEKAKSFAKAGAEWLHDNGVARPRRTTSCVPSLKPPRHRSSAQPSPLRPASPSPHPIAGVAP